MGKGKDLPTHHFSGSKLLDFGGVLHMSQKPEFKVMVMFTPPKINIELENDGLEDDVPLPGVSCQVPC